eukprot:8604060-Karenia_brevis.AAC.1
MTCLDCGFTHKEKVENKPRYKFEDCPHDEIDRRRSDKKKVRIFCKQCCQYIECMDRDDMTEVYSVNKKMTIASTTQQKLAGQLLDEQVLTRGELTDTFSVFQDLLKNNMKDKETITS